MGIAFLTLTLFVVGILGADNHNSAVSFDNLAFVAHRFNTGSDFHDNLQIMCLFVSVNNSTFCKIVRGHFNTNLVAFKDTDVVYTQLSAEISKLIGKGVIESRKNHFKLL